MSEIIPLLPQPKQMTLTGETARLPREALIRLEGEHLPGLRFSAGRLQKVLKAKLGANWALAKHRGGNEPLWQPAAGLSLIVAPAAVSEPQGYELTICPECITIVGHDEPGVFYGVCTLIQIIEQGGASLPCLWLHDWPDFPARGVMLDISRDKVPTMDTLFMLVEMLAGWKINQLQLYMEHTFAYRRHPAVWAEASPLTPAEIQALDAFCRQRYVELVPNQNSFGHMQRWLKHPAYLPLAEVSGSFATPWGMERGPFSLCPTDPGSLELVRGLYDELLPNFSSLQVNVGCDETFDLGAGRSQPDCAARGAGRVYLDFLLAIHREVQQRGRQMQFWGDIILNSPEFIPELPKDAIALEWGYEAAHPFDAHGAQFAAAGIPFYVCPGTSSWNSLAGRTTNALANLRQAAENGLKHGAVGYLNTDWGDNGHWQPLPVSFLGLAAGAAFSWTLEANRDLDFAEALNRYAFGDAAGVMGKIACDLGDLYKLLDLELSNCTPLFEILHKPFEWTPRHPTLTAAAFDRTEQALDEILGRLDQAKINRPDATVILAEYRLVGHLLRHAIGRGRLATAAQPEQCVDQAAALDADLDELMGEFQQVWLRRNRPGGLPDSLKLFEKLRSAYRQALPV